MISADGVKANVVCSSCEHCRSKWFSKKPGDFTLSYCYLHNENRKDKEKALNPCNQWEMSKFFKERGYKVVTNEQE